MIATIIILSFAFTWLFYETDYLRVRLPVYYKPVIILESVQCDSKPVEVVEDSLPLPDTTPATIPMIDNAPLLLSEVCEFTRIQRELTDNKGRSKYIRQWDNRPCKTTAYQTMTIGNQTITLNAALPNLYQLIADVKDTQTEKLRPPIVKSYTSIPMFIEQVRVGSHNEYARWNDDTKELETRPKYKVGYHHRVVEDYTTEYHDCLPGKDWLKAHEHDLDNYEATIDISIDSKAISINGNYKKGMIKDFVKEYTGTIKRNRKVLVEA